MSIEIRANDVRVHRGYLAVRNQALNDMASQAIAEVPSIPDPNVENRKRRDGNDFHMTLVDARAMRSLSKAQLEEFRQGLIGQSLLPLGVGKSGGCRFVVVSCPHAGVLRRKYGLPKQDFHVTLAFPEDGDQHDVAKDATTIVHHFDIPVEEVGRWLQMARTNFVAIRKRQEHALDLQDICVLMRDLTKNIQAKPTKQSSLLQQSAKLWCKAAGLALDYSSVITAASIWLEEAPEDAQALGYLGFAQFKLTDYATALASLERAQAAFGTPPPEAHKTQAYQVEDCIVACCTALGRELPLPPLIKFPRTTHLFRPEGSQAITDDDEVLPKNSALMQAFGDGETTVIMQEKVDGSNLGISLSLDGRDILVQNRSHYVNKGEHAQYGALPAWIQVHREALLRILDAPKKRSSRHGWILYGEWLMARHSIPYHRLPGQFMAFDLFDISTGRFVSQARLHAALQGSGIPVCPCIGERSFAPGTNVEAELLRLLDTESQFRADGGPLEGVVFRIEEGDWVKNRCKLVRPDFVAGCSEGHWSKRTIEKQTVDFEFAEAYMRECYSAAPDGQDLPTTVDNPRQRAVVVYKDPARTLTPKVVLQTGTGGQAEGQSAVIMPRNLSWLWPNEVAVSSTPKNGEQIRAFHDAMNVGLIITLTKEEPLHADWFFGGCQNYFVPIPNYFPPTSLAQMDGIGDDIVRSVVSGRAVMEHCGGGKGRAGTVAACLLLRFGPEGIRARIRDENANEVGRSLRPRAPFMGSDEAIAMIRRMRPGSLETEMQEDFVREYAQHLWRQATDEETSEDEERPNTITGAATSAPRKGAPKYVVMAGLPGSGKSTISRLLSMAGSCNAKNGTAKAPPSSFYVHANQDDMGHRACVDFVGRMSAHVGRGEQAGIIVDCTNVTAKHRRDWLAVMHNPPRDQLALLFVDSPTEMCLSRVRGRVDHPTIPFGRGDRIVDGFAKKLEPPTAEETERFGFVRVIRSQNDLKNTLAVWGISLADDV